MKKRLFVICLCIILVAISVVFGTLAYFTDTNYSDIQSVVVGNVKLQLLDTGRDVETLVHDDVIVPGRSFDKTLTVANVGSCDAYVRLHIILEEQINSLFAFQLTEDVLFDPTMDPTGAMLPPVSAGADPVFLYSSSRYTEDGKTYVCHTFTCKQLLLAGATSSSPCISMKLRNELDNADFENIGDLEVVFRMEGIQSSSDFADVHEAFVAFQQENKP